MFLRIFGLLLISSCLLANSLAPVPTVYRNAVMGLKLYRSHPLYNPVTYSLLNILIHNKQAKAFVSDEAIEMALYDIKEFDQKAASNNEPLLRQLIYGTYCKNNVKNCVRSNRKKINHVSSDLAQQIASALDEYFTDDNPDYYQTIAVYNGNKD